MKIQWKNLITCIAIPLAVGALASLLTKNSMENFAMLNKPAFAPPGFLFPVVWTILYVLMGIASYLVVTSKQPTGNALTVYGIQLVFNFFWSIFFFNFGLCLFAFIWLVLLWAAIAGTALLFRFISKPAGWLMLPYLAWVTFAGYLNLGVYILNR